MDLQILATESIVTLLLLRQNRVAAMELDIL